MEDFTGVPVLDVSKNNFHSYFPRIQREIEEASLIGIDLELSGLGDRKYLNGPCMEDRYRNARITGSTRSIIALGLSLFKETKQSKDFFTVATYNIYCLCSENYIVEPGSLKFLVEHGFDFTKQYSDGILYYRGNDREGNEFESGPRQLLETVVRAGKPLVLHNGFIDLIFLYSNFYGALPESLGSFVADVSEMFSGGIYDTKYVAEYILRTSSSYLEFLFFKFKWMNYSRSKKGKGSIHISFSLDEGENKNLNIRQCGSFEKDCESTTEHCDSYANHGYCTKGNDCPLSHNIIAIVKNDGSRRKKRKIDVVDTNKKTKKDINGTSNFSSFQSDGHRAGFDAFMTAYAFVSMTRSIKNYESETSKNFKNKIYLVSKDHPLLISKSSFTKSSNYHTKKLNQIKNSSSV